MSRRGLLAGVTAAAGGFAATDLRSPARAAGAAGAQDRVPGAVIGPDDPRYAALTTGNNQRFVARPDYVKLARSTDDVAAALQEAVDAGKRVSVRSGGHCFSDFACNPEIEVIIDLSEMAAVDYDPEVRAFTIEPGARLEAAYESLYKGWGVTLPAGICYSVGIGGHIAGGGYGLLSRDHGLTVDHLYMVEVVTVDADRRVRVVRASREPDDPNRELWWGHTGGGGGNFGIVTRYWFRSPGATGTAPMDQLISPPAEVLISALQFPWDQLDEATFSRLLKNFGAWHQTNSAPDSPFTKLSSLFNVNHRAAGALGMFTQVDATAPDADALLHAYIEAIIDGTDLRPEPAETPIGELGSLPGFLVPRRLPWMQATKLVGSNNPTITDPTSRAAHKSGYQRRNFSDVQLGALYRAMTREDFHNPDTMLVVFSFGGQVNAARSDDTANAQRDSIFKMCFQTFWADPADDDYYMSWVRELYSDFYSETGGVPVPNGDMDGCYINYPDNDVADPAWNKSGLPWSYLYYKDNYPRLQQVKEHWDPNNIFRHALSIELP
ncbi:MAG: FAD-binding protein [Azospirillaceae bacterium]